MRSGARLTVETTDVAHVLVTALTKMGLENENVEGWSEIPGRGVVVGWGMVNTSTVDRRGEAEFPDSPPDVRNWDCPSNFVDLPVLEIRFPSPKAWLVPQIGGDNPR